MNNDLKIIKKVYGEKMMHLCRELFSTLLEQEGLLSKLMLDNFAPSRLLYNDIVSDEYYVASFKNYIYSLVNVEKMEISVKKTPKELLEEAGYDLYECESEEDIQKFKKYYAPGEALCTFNGGRLNNCYVFFAVKKNVNEIKRENFEYPERQDEYGTSVISIQFTRGGINTLSIKNRYNHTVNNPDATFSNNLDNIIYGLTDSFKKTYNLNINQNNNNEFELPNYVMAEDGKYYKYNYEVENVYYCPNNIIIENYRAKEFPKEKYIVFEDYILDLCNKKIEKYDNIRRDSFLDGLKNIKQININKLKDSENKQIEIITETNNKIIIEIDETNQITGYINNELKEIGKFFMYHNRVLRCLELNNLEKVDDSFLYSNKELTTLNLPSLIEINDYFLYNNKFLNNLNLPNLEIVGNGMLFYNEKITKLNLPNLQVVGSRFLFSNNSLEELNVPNLIRTRQFFLVRNEKLKRLNIDSLIKAGDDFLISNHYLEEMSALKLEQVGDSFLYKNKCLKKFYAPNLIVIGDFFMAHNSELETLELPSLKGVGNSFLQGNYELKHLYVPKLERVGYSFLLNNMGLKYLNVPNLKEKGNHFLIQNSDLTLYAPSLSSRELYNLSFQFNIVNKEIKIDEESKKSYK